MSLVLDGLDVLEVVLSTTGWSVGSSWYRGLREAAPSRNDVLWLRLLWFYEVLLESAVKAVSSKARLTLARFDLL